MPATVDYPPAFAAHYDEVTAAHPQVVRRGDVAHYRKLARAAGGPWCEIGAGSGRVFVPVAQAVPQPATAVEPAGGMLARLHERVAALPAPTRRRIHVTAGDFEATGLPEASQALVVSAFRSFGHLLTVAAQRAALAEVRRVLRPGGAFAFDLFDPDPEVLVDAAPVETACFDTPRGTRVRRLDGRRVHPAEQTVELAIQWIEEGRDGALVARREHTLVYRYCFRAELEHLLALAGFTDVSVRGDFAGGPVTDEPEELVIVAR